MTILSRLKALLGLADAAPVRTVAQQPTAVEPAAESERAVKAPVSELEGQRAPSATDSSDEGRHPVDSVTGIGPTYRERLASAGIYSVDELANAEPATVAAESDISQGRVAQWVERATDR